MTTLEASNCYPIFIVWNSGMISSYVQHLFNVRQGEEHHIVSTLSAPGVFISDLAIGVARLPQTYVGRIYSDLRTTELIPGSLEQKGMDHLYDGLATIWKGFYNLQDPTAKWEGFETLIHSNKINNYHNPLKEDGKRSLSDRLTRLTEYIVSTPSKIATLPIVDGLGTPAWAVMQRRTETMFNPPMTYEVYSNLTAWRTESNTPRAVNSVSNWLHSGSKSGAMYSFAESLKDWQNPTNGLKCSQQTNCTLSFDFCGHSMGAMVLNELFRRNPTIQASNIVYLAAACSIIDFENALFPYLTTNSGTQFYSVSLHRMRERDEYCLAELEGNAWFGWISHIYFLRDITVRGSLLNWIDDIFEKPNTIPERTMGAWENITRTLPDIPDSLWPQIHLRACDLEPLNALNPFCRLNGTNEPQDHGDFTRSIYWSPQFYWPTSTNNCDFPTNNLPLRAD